MVCTTVRNGSECIFMSKNGCQFSGGSCHPITDKCDGCQRVVEYLSEKYCMIFPDPASKWKNGACNMATHIQAEAKKVGTKINPLKASKRSH